MVQPPVFLSLATERILGKISCKHWGATSVMVIVAAIAWPIPFTLFLGIGTVELFTGHVQSSSSYVGLIYAQQGVMSYICVCVFFLLFVGSISHVYSCSFGTIAYSVGVHIVLAIKTTCLCFYARGVATPSPQIADYIICTHPCMGLFCTTTNANIIV